MAERVVTDPNSCGGRPAVRGTCIMAQTVVEFLAAGDNIEDALDEYPGLTRENILACLRFAAQMMARRAGSIPQT